MKLVFCISAKDYDAAQKKATELATLGYKLDAKLDMFVVDSPEALLSICEKHPCIVGESDVSESQNIARYTAMMDNGLKLFFGECHFKDEPEKEPKQTLKTHEEPPSTTKANVKPTRRSDGKA